MIEGAPVDPFMVKHLNLAFIQLMLEIHPGGMWQDQFVVHRAEESHDALHTKEKIVNLNWGIKGGK